MTTYYNLIEYKDNIKEPSLRVTDITVKVIGLYNTYDSALKKISECIRDSEYVVDNFILVPEHTIYSHKRAVRLSNKSGTVYRSCILNRYYIEDEKYMIEDKYVITSPYAYAIVPVTLSDEYVDN